MVKKKLSNPFTRGRIIGNILRALAERHHFLIVGHRSPDEDCIASMAAMGLLVTKFHNDAMLYFGGEVHEHFQFLLDICTYNSIGLLIDATAIDKPVDTIIICDTPKTSMIDLHPDLRHLLSDPAVLKIEIDHHIGGDSNVTGDPGYRLIDAASSAAELIGFISLKLRKKKKLLERYDIADPLSRNLVLAILTGIIGDSKMGTTLKSRREEKFYRIFSGLYNSLLAKGTTKVTNFSDMSEVFGELQRLSAGEARCYSYMMEKQRYSESIAYVVLSREDMERMSADYDKEQIITVSRSVADALAERSGCVSLVAFFEQNPHGDLIQFRMRRSSSFKLFDLRTILERFGIENGGGHEGAIGFRYRAEDVPDLEYTVHRLIEGVEEQLQKTNPH